MASAAGSSGPGRWWSVTSTDRPSALASATPATLAMPLSTVISRSAPRFFTRRGVGGGDGFQGVRWQQTGQVVVEFVFGAHAARGIQAGQQGVYPGLLERPDGTGGDLSS